MYVYLRTKPIELKGEIILPAFVSSSYLPQPKAFPSSRQETLSYSYSYSSFQLLVTTLSSCPCSPREGKDSLLLLLTIPFGFL